MMFDTRRPMMLVAVIVFTLLGATGCATQSELAYGWLTLDGKRPVVIAHRGDSGNYPEHTLAGYESAARLGADYIEPDLVLTKDNVLVCRHDLHLSSTTDVASHVEFAKYKTKIGSREDWHANRFTLTELKSLRAAQSIAKRPAGDALLQVPTLSELVALTNRFNKDRERGVGLLIEIKEPAQHRKLGLDPSKQALDLLANYKKAGRIPAVIFQCFDRAEAQRLAGMTDYPVVWLSSKVVDLDNMPKGIAGLGLDKKLIDIDEEGRSKLIDAAHERGLFVYVWTFRDDKLDGTGYDDAGKELVAYLSAGVDGVITDYPETGLKARAEVADQWRVKLTSKIARQNGPRRHVD